MDNILAAFLLAQLILTPILGLILIGMRNENIRKERLLRSCLRALAIVGVTRGNRR